MTEASNTGGAEPTHPPLLSSPEKKIAIFGTTPSRMEGPIQDNTGWERWTIGPGGKDTHSWERLFEVHHRWPEDFKGYLADLSILKPPKYVYSLSPMPGLMAKWKLEHGKSDEDYAKEIPGDWSGNVVIPRAHLEERYGRTWFSSSISWLMALAIEEGATDIGLWGIDLESGEEYTAQFIGGRHFIDLARLVGINVHLPQGCGLMREPTPYPNRYETHFALHTERKLKWLTQMLVQMEGEYEARSADMHRCEGGLLTMRGHGAPEDEIKAREKELMEINRHVGHLAASINRIKGEQSATEYYRRMYVYEPRDPEMPG